MRALGYAGRGRLVGPAFAEVRIMMLSIPSTRPTWTATALLFSIGCGPIQDSQSTTGDPIETLGSDASSPFLPGPFLPGPDASSPFLPAPDAGDPSSPDGGNTLPMPVSSSCPAPCGGVP